MIEAAIGSDDPQDRVFINAIFEGPAALIGLTSEQRSNYHVAWRLKAHPKNVALEKRLRAVLEHLERGETTAIKWSHGFIDNSPEAKAAERAEQLLALAKAKG